MSPDNQHMKIACYASIVLLALAAASRPAAAQTGTVTATWDAATGSGHVGYMLYYGTVPGVYTNSVDVGNVTTKQLALPVGVTYYFVVKSYGAGGALSDSSNPASGGVFTDSSLVPGATAMRALHVTELRARIDAVRLLRGLTPYLWSSVVTGGVPVRATHLTEMQTALNQAYDQAGVARPSYASVAEGTLIRAQHVTELRAAVATLEAFHP
jgi:hypothetical protein